MGREFQKGWFMLKVLELLAYLRSLMISQNIARPQFFLISENKLRLQFVTVRSEVNQDRQTPPVTPEVLLSNSTLKKATGIWLEITPRFFSFEIQYFSRVLFIPKKEIRQ